MAKPKRRYICTECGSVTHRWQGQCADCSQWNTLVEDAPETAFSARHDLSGGGRPVMFEPLDSPVEALPLRAVWFGEVSLSGEVRPVAHPGLRLREAAKLGFDLGHGPVDGASKIAEMRYSALAALPNLVDRVMASA